MENYEYATSCAPYQSMFHAIECDPMQSNFGSTHKNVLIGGVPSGQDGRLYNLGNLQLAVQGQANNSGVIGEFWITYEIAFFKPLFSVGQGLNLLSDKYSGVTSVTASVQWMNFPGALPTLRSGSLLGTTYQSVGNGTITFPSNIAVGTFMISIVGTPTAAWSNGATCSAPTVTNGTLLQVWDLDLTASPSYPLQNGSGNSACATYFISVNAPGASQCVFTCPAISAVITNTINFDIVITQVNGSITT